MVHRREVDGREIRLGNQGDLYLRAMTWWDHETGSVWSQPTGEAILGPLRGRRLDLLPSTLTDWATWRRSHPETLAIDGAGRDTRFALEQMALVVELDGVSRAYPYVEVRDLAGGVVNDVVAGHPIAVVAPPALPGTWAVLSRELEGGERVGLRADGEVLREVPGERAWDPARGLLLGAPTDGSQDLRLLPAFTSFASDYRNHYPSGSVWSASSG